MRVKRREIIVAPRPRLAELPYGFRFSPWQLSWAHRRAEAAVRGSSPSGRNDQVQSASADPQLEL
jgi:hypothetical protein